MNVKVVEKGVLSSDKIHVLKGKLYVPDGEIKGYFHVVHGMTEHIGRYHEFLMEIASHGYLAFAYDALGHGHTVNDNSELGYIAKKDGYNLLLQDVYEYSNAVQLEYGKRPYYLMGHSMGSFIVRLAAAHTVSPDKLIVMGTGGANPLASIGLAIIALLKAFKGDKHVSKFIDGVAFGSYNKRFKEENNKRSWLTTLPEIWDKYSADPLCNYRFTLSAMRDLITMNKNSNKGEWYKAINKELPIYLVSGSDDPVGEYGKGVLSVYNKLKKHGANASVKIYDGARHEILNDFTREEVISDILKFIQ